MPSCICSTHVSTQRSSHYKRSSNGMTLPLMIMKRALPKIANHTITVQGGGGMQGGGWMTQSGGLGRRPPSSWI
jgi:hypothetical protein